MKAKSNTAFILRLSLTLLAICTVVAALLAAVNSYTAPIIAKQKEEKTQLAIEAVLPGGGCVCLRWRLGRAGECQRLRR